MMKKSLRNIFIFLLPILVVMLAHFHVVAQSEVPIKRVAALPATCSPVSVRMVLVYKYTPTAGIYRCTAIDTWTILGGSGGTGLLSLNGLTADPQSFAVGTAGTNFNIASSGSTHTFNFPNASATARGLLTSADWTTFNNKGNGDVTLTGTQTLTNKTFSGANNTFSNIAQSSITNLTSDLALKAPLASPAFTGTPTAPTATQGTNTTQLATTAFVQTAISGLSGGSGSSGTTQVTNLPATASAGSSYFETSTGKFFDVPATNDFKERLLAGTTIGAANGGTGQTSFAKGDILAASGTTTLTKETVGANKTVLTADSSDANGVKWTVIPAEIILAASDETTAITVGTAKITFRMPYAMTVTQVRASLTTASSSGLPTFNIKESGTTIFSTKLTVNANAKTSTTATTPAVLSDTVLADDAEITIDFDVAGTGATGVKIYIIGYRN